MYLFKDNKDNLKTLRIIIHFKVWQLFRLVVAWFDGLQIFVLVSRLLEIPLNRSFNNLKISFLQNFEDNLEHKLTKFVLCFKKRV